MPNDMSWQPKAADGIEINAVADGYIVNQPERDRVHYLNHTAAIVLELCTGKNQAADLPELLRLAYNMSAPPREEVEECLQTLKKEGLIT